MFDIQLLELVLAIAVSTTPIQGDSNSPESIWKVDASIMKQLTQTVKVGDYQLSLPANYTGGENRRAPAGFRSAAWKGIAQDGKQPGLVIFTIMSDSTEAKANMRQALVNFSAGVTDSMGVTITTRAKTETGTIAGLSFSRFTWTASTKNQLEVKGIVYGTIDNGKVISFIVMGFEPDASAQNKWHESIVATLRKR